MPPSEDSHPDPEWEADGPDGQACEQASADAVVVPRSAASTGWMSRVGLVAKQLVSVATLRPCR